MPVLGTAAFSRLFGGRLPDWGVGVALPGGRVVAVDHARLPAVGRGLREVFLHEMTHALLMRAGGDVPLPAWLHEGLAMRLSGEWRFSDTVTLAMEGRVPDLSDLRGAFPGGAQRASRAYLTSELAVDRLLEAFGRTWCGACWRPPAARATSAKPSRRSPARRWKCSRIASPRP